MRPFYSTLLFLSPLPGVGAGSFFLLVRLFGPISFVPVSWYMESWVRKAV